MSKTTCWIYESSQQITKPSRDIRDPQHKYCGYGLFCEFFKSEYMIIIMFVLPLFHFREITEIREITRKSGPRNSLESAEYIKVITGLLNAKDFRDRINGIKQLLSDTENNQELVVGNIVKVRTVKINFHVQSIVNKVHQYNNCLIS